MAKTRSNGAIKTAYQVCHPVLHNGLFELLQLIGGNLGGKRVRVQGSVDDHLYQRNQRKDAHQHGFHTAVRYVCMVMTMMID